MARWLESRALGAILAIAGPLRTDCRGLGGGQRGHGLFAAFPPPDVGISSPGGQHWVFAAEAVQLVGTVDAEVLGRHLRATGDGRWRPLLVGAVPELPPSSGLGGAVERAAAASAGAGRTPLSVGIGSFRNTSSGTYLEMAVAFPACQVPLGEPAMQMLCTSFLTCQDQLPDCAYTYMLLSYTNVPAAVEHIRASGVDARLVPAFRYEVQPATAEAGAAVSFSITGPEGEEVLAGTVETSPPLRDDHADHDGEGGRGERRSMFTVGRGPGFRTQMFVGSPGVAIPEQLRHICAFPDDLDAGPVRISGPMSAGDLLGELKFELEAAFHMPNLRVVRLPPWGAAPTSTPNAPAPQVLRPPPPSRPARHSHSAAAAAASPFGGIGGEVQMEGGRRAPWATASASGSAGAPVESLTTSRHRRRDVMETGPRAAVGGSEFPWALHQERAPQEPAAPRPLAQLVAGAAGGAAAGSAEAAAAAKVARGGSFPWHLHEA